MKKEHTGNIKFFLRKRKYEALFQPSPTTNKYQLGLTDDNLIKYYRK